MEIVFPARAGMNRVARLLDRIAERVPRASGDEPAVSNGTDISDACSPRERG